MKHLLRRHLSPFKTPLQVLLVLLLIGALVPAAQAGTVASLPLAGRGPEPGTAPAGQLDGAAQPAAIDAPAAAIAPMVTVTGKVNLSVDGVGSNNSDGGIVQVEKPAGATVRNAYMAAASTGFSGHVIANGDVKIDGASVNWGTSLANSIGSYNYWADVTSLVKPKVDAAPAGRVSFRITEVNSPAIDGEILAVIFDDPGQIVDNTVVLLFGAQNVAGDTFAIGLANPINLADPNLALNLSLGTSFGFQWGSNIDQISLIEVNGQRVSSSSGGQDDCVDAAPCENGALITVGGLDDSTANPPDPYGPPQGNPAFRYDDELYDLKPFVHTGDSQISVFTRNPSTDDNIFFSALLLKSTAAVVGEGILLAPVSATNPIGTMHTVTATVQNDFGQPIAGRQVTIAVIAGPNAGTSASGPTDALGKFVMSYLGVAPGNDTLEASMINSQGVLVKSNQATKTWEGGAPTNAMVFGWAFLDTNLDGFRQDTEQAGVASLPITLSQGGSPIATTMTVGPDGYYLFNDVPPGDYCVAISLTPKWVPTSPTQVCFTIPAAAVTSAVARSLPLQAKGAHGSNGAKNDAMPQAIDDVPLPVGGGWASFNFGGPGSFDSEGAFTFATPGPAAVKVTDAFCRGDRFRIYDNGVPIGDTSAVPVGECGTSDPDIAFADPTFSHGSFQVGGGNHAITIQAIDSPFGSGGAFLRADLSAFKVVNFGLRPSKATIGDFVWFDINGNGVQDPGEPGIPGVTLALRSSAGGAPGAILANTVTGPDGKYAFSPIIAGDYFVQVTDAAHVLAGLTLTVGPQSKPNPFGPITIHDGDAYLDADFGYAFLCAPDRGVIAGRVWNDANGNGAQDPTEAGIPGIQVAAEPLSYLPTRAATTNMLGIYMMCVPPGTYLVNPLNPPAHMTPTQQFNLPVLVHAGEWLANINYGYK